VSSTVSNRGLDHTNGRGRKRGELFGSGEACNTEKSCPIGAWHNHGTELTPHGNPDGGQKSCMASFRGSTDQLLLGGDTERTREYCLRKGKELQKSSGNARTVDDAEKKGKEKKSLKAG